MECTKFKSKTIVPVESPIISCGLCEKNLSCPIARNPNFNGRTQYTDKQINTMEILAQEINSVKLTRYHID